MIFLVSFLHQPGLCRQTKERDGALRKSSAVSRWGRRGEGEAKIIWWNHHQGQSKGQEGPESPTETPYSSESHFLLVTQWMLSLNFLEQSSCQIWNIHIPVGHYEIFGVEWQRHRQVCECWTLAGIFPSSCYKRPQTNGSQGDVDLQVFMSVNYH